ncbi:MAG: 50S ribosomal protein L21 [Candidatus Paceibacterota bacterium]
MFYIIETGGKQYKVFPGETLKIEKLPNVKVGEKVVFDKVLLVDDGKETKIGDPYLKGEKLEAKLVEEGRGKKIVVIRFKNKTRYHKKYGHRQPFVKVKIT